MPRWSRNGRTLFYALPSWNNLASVTIETEPFLSIESRAVVTLEDRRPIGFDVLDGDGRFVIGRQPSAEREWGVVFNWVEELKRLVGNQ